MSEPSDIECIDALLSGNDRAFETIVERYTDRIYALVAGIVANSSEAEEIVNDIFLAVWKGAGRFRRESSFSTWIYRIAFNHAVSATRRRKPTTLFDEERLQQVADDDQSLFEECDYERLDAALRQLSSRENLIIRLFYTESMPIEHIASVVDTSVANIKVILHRSRRKLQLIITDYAKRQS